MMRPEAPSSGIVRIERTRCSVRQDTWEHHDRSGTVALADRGERGSQVIVTVTLNAALDVAYEAEGLSWQSTRDVSRVRYRAGGRGVAVARVLHTFGHDVVAAGLAGGAAGELIREDLSRSGIPVAFTAIGRESRRVLEVTDTEGGRTIRLREPGPYVTTEELGRFAGDYRRMLSDATAVVLCGTLPAGLPPEIYGSLATYAAEAGVPVILSAGGSALRYAAARRPDLVIPDAGGDAVRRPGPGAAVAGAGDAVPWTESGEGAGDADAPGGTRPDDALLRLGAAAVATPSAGRLRVVTKAGRWKASLAAPGTGDDTGAAPGSLGALVAGLVPGLLLGWSWPDLLRHAVAVAAAADMSGTVNLSVYEGLLDSVTVEAAG
jgi:tagatose 6-phosphate kinase